MFGGFGYRPEELRFLINKSLALCCVSVYFSCAAAAFMFEGLRIPIREHKVHCFRLDSVLGCYMPFLPYIGRCLGVPAVARYSVGWSVFHGAHTAVLGIGFFGNPFCHCPYAQSQRHQGTCATDRWGLPFPTDARISNVSPHMPL